MRLGKAPAMGEWQEVLEEEVLEEEVLEQEAFGQETLEEEEHGRPVLGAQACRTGRSGAGRTW
jgi:hypothetical protein